MTLKEQLLQIKTGDELKAKWEEFAEIDLSDPEVVQHISNLLDPFWAPEEYHQDALKK